MKKGNATFAALALTSLLSLQLVYCIRQSLLATQIAYCQSQAALIDQLADFVSEQLFAIAQGHYQSLVKILSVREVNGTLDDKQLNLIVHWCMSIEDTESIRLAIDITSTRGKIHRRRFRVMRFQQELQLERIP